MIQYTVRSLFRVHWTDLSVCFAWVPVFSTVSNISINPAVPSMFTADSVIPGLAVCSESA